MDLFQFILEINQDFNWFDFSSRKLEKKIVLQCQEESLHIIFFKLLKVIIYQKLI